MRRLAARGGMTAHAGSLQEHAPRLLSFKPRTARPPSEENEKRRTKLTEPLISYHWYALLCFFLFIFIRIVGTPTMAGWSLRRAY